MDELTNNEIEEYLSDLPLSVLELIQDKTWGKRVSEISAKYSLSEEQDTILRNLVLFVFIGAEEADTLKDSIKTELSISDLLTEQIINDLDERVFQYAFNQISEETSEPKNEIVSEDEETIRMKDETGLENLRSMTGDIKSFKEPEQKIYEKPAEEKPEVKEENKIIEEVVPKEEISKNLPTLDNEYLPAKDNEYIPVMKGSNFIPNNLPGIEIEQKPKEEVVQKPVEVPRFTASPEALKKESEPEQKQNFANLADSKLNSTISSQKETIKKEIPAKYSVDPYREPLG